MPFHPAAIFLLGLLAAQPEPSSAVQNTEQIVLGRRYDLSVEVSERLDAFATLSQWALTVREAYLGRVDRQVASLSGLPVTQTTLNQRLAEVEAAVKALTPLHPVCTYAIDKSGGHLLSPEGRGALDVLARVGERVGRSALLEQCQRIEKRSVGSRHPCEWVVLGASHPILERTGYAISKDLAARLDSPDESANLLFEGWEDSAMLVTARRVALHGDLVDCSRSPTEPLRQACLALRAKDAKACPRWEVGSADGQRGLLLDPDRALESIDYVLTVVRAGDAVVIATAGGPALRCTLEGAADPSGKPLPWVDLPPTRERIGTFEVKPADEKGSVTATCHVSREARRGTKAGPGQAPGKEHGR